MDLELKPVMREDIETVWKMEIYICTRKWVITGQGGLNTLMIGWTLCFMKRTDIDRIGLAAKQTLK